MERLQIIEKHKLERDEMWQRLNLKPSSQILKVALIDGILLLWEKHDVDDQSTQEYDIEMTIDHNYDNLEGRIYLDTVFMKSVYHVFYKPGRVIPGKLKSYD